MDNATFFLVLPFLLTFIYVFTTSSRRNPRLPPGPYPFPIIGNLLLLTNKPHRSLAALSERYGPLMSLKLGSRTTIVVSSPDIAQEFFQKHDQSFSSRSIPETARVMDHHKYSVAWLPAGDEWRKLRRITKECLFSGQCLDGSQQLRRQKVQELVDHVSRCCTEEKVVNVGEVAFTTNLNILSNLLFSKDFSQYDSLSSQEIKDVIGGVMEVRAKPNLVDFFPILRPLDPQGLASQGSVYANKLFAIFDSIIDQRLQTRGGISSSYDNDSSTQSDVLDLLLNINFKDESEFSINDMKHLFSDLFAAGTDTVSTTLEWALTELIRNPKEMERARLELTKSLQNNDKILQERDIPQLPYLQAVIKETLRLHPPTPFLIPHEATHDVEVEGFIIPKNARILCNVWAIGRDPNIWPNTNEFMPERFLDSEIDYRGQDFKLIPFGAGRRLCPGLNIAHRMLHIMLGSLIYNFDWKLQGNMRPQDLDMEDKFGLTLPRNVPLMAIPVKVNYAHL
ncbi:putative geraniol 8-hydroxylase [Helianthus annuus]|uniref:Geraniol 8-hydroxylase n=1 Tax=Helianthus annuus TaxID=4232 RepID=A0A251TS50_HELAN|nr:cytochrome P450 76T24 [Helianthus annuus]KAF5788887.1 putative geraniol 8-hydroxylase [Helianthus annuus]KAJ0532100.1 putative geraniol 8-hydroxylase [Helianthus annuus]